MTSVVAAKV